MNAIKSNGHPTELACLGRDVNPSPLGRVVAEILAIVWRGLHHLDPRLLKKVDWADTYLIVIDFELTSFSTHDWNQLTQLVVIAHDACVRLDISSPAMKRLRLLFHERVRAGSYSERHPTLEEHAALIRQQYTIGAPVGKESEAKS